VVLPRSVWVAELTSLSGDCSTSSALPPIPVTTRAVATTVTVTTMMSANKKGSDDDDDDDGGGNSGGASGRQLRTRFVPFHPISPRTSVDESAGRKQKTQRPQSTAFTVFKGVVVSEPKGVAVRGALAPRPPLVARAVPQPTAAATVLVSIPSPSQWPKSAPSLRRPSACRRRLCSARRVSNFERSLYHGHDNSLFMPVH
jgi:hypothetical protein